MANKEPKPEINVEELKAQLRAELQQEMEAEREAAEKKASKEEARLERELAKQEKSMKAILDAQPKKLIHIPENPMNPNEVVPVGVNGVIYAIPVGQDFEVPQSIYETWKYSYEKTREANKRMEEVLKKEITIL
ncbi:MULTISPECIES: hypothetical protein [unclassified Peribacillus]|uniref:hypothetical protein n=1 Tax=unclassified Peribacillus TaxID=2675266 RepID=UPI00366C2154